MVHEGGASSIAAEGATGIEVEGPGEGVLPSPAVVLNRLAGGGSIS